MDRLQSCKVPRNTDLGFSFLGTVTDYLLALTIGKFLPATSNEAFIICVCLVKKLIRPESALDLCGFR